jgi:hypothetical protein
MKAALMDDAGEAPKRNKERNREIIGVPWSKYHVLFLLSASSMANRHDDNGSRTRMRSEVGAVR